MSRTIRLVSLMMAGAVGLAACGGSSSTGHGQATSKPSSGTQLVYFIFTGYTPPYFAPMAQAIQTAASHYPDLKVKIVSANGSASQEISDINTAVAGGAKGVILNPVDGSVTTAAEHAVSQGIPVVTIDRDVDSPSGRFAFIGDSDVKLGEQSAAACFEAAKAANLPVPFHVAILQGTLGASTAIDRLQGAMTVVKAAEQAHAATVVLNQSANFDTATAQSLMSEFLSKSPNLQMVIAGNDAMALGAINAMSSAGVTPGKKAVVCGADAQPESLTDIKNGTQAVTVTHSPYVEAFWAVEAMQNYLVDHIKPPANKFPNGDLLVPQTVVTKSNVTQVSAWGTPSTVPRLPYGTSAAYPSS